MFHVVRYCHTDNPRRKEYHIIEHPSADAIGSYTFNGLDQHPIGAFETFEEAEAEIHARGFVALGGVYVTPEERDELWLLVG